MRLSLLLLFWTASAFGLVTAYVSFDQPEGWNCELAEGVWICQSTLEPDRKESIVLSIATVAGEWDTLDNYETYLKKPKTIQDEEGNELTSKATYVRRRNINGVNWVDSLQFNSELPGFYARYLATVHRNLAILITYIVSEDRYSSLGSQFERMVASLKTNDEFDLSHPSKTGDVMVPGSEVLGSKLNALVRNRVGKKKAAEVVAPAPENNPAALIGVLLLVVLSGYYILKVRKKKKTQR